MLTANSKPFSTVPTSPFVCTVPYATIANMQYKDTPRSRWEAHNVAVSSIAAFNRAKSRESAERILANLELLTD